MIARLIVNRHVIKSNRKHRRREPPLVVQTSIGVEYASKIDILDDSGKIIASLLYRPNKPLGCGAEVFIETKHERLNYS